MRFTIKGVFLLTLILGVWLGADRVGFMRGFAHGNAEGAKSCRDMMYDSGYRDGAKDTGDDVYRDIAFRHISNQLPDHAQIICVRGPWDSNRSECFANVLVRYDNWPGRRYMTIECDFTGKEVTSINMVGEDDEWAAGIERALQEARP